MPKEFGLINQPVSTDSHLFDGIVDDPEATSTPKESNDVFEKKERQSIKVQERIAGRVPISSGAFGLVNGIDTNLGTGMRLALFRGLKEVGLGFVETIYDNAGGDFELPAGIALLLKYKEKNYASGSGYVKEDDVRKACDDAFREAGRDVIWVESEAVTDIGGGLGGTMPLGEVAEASLNLKLSGVIKYRRLEPYETASGTLLQGQAFANAANIPVTASLARKMPPGGEFEFTGEGHLSLNPEISKPLGYAGDLGSVGASAKFGAEGDVKREMTISVQRLPNGERVLVKVAQGTSANASIGGAVKAGVKMNEGTYEKVPELGRGFLKFLLDRMGLPDVPKFVKRFMQSQIHVKSRTEKRGSEIARYVFDLSMPSARKAYEAMFTRFSLGNAQELVSANDGSVRAQKAGESATVSERGAAAILGQTTLYLTSDLQAERSGKVNVDGVRDVLFGDSKFEKVYSNWFSGEQRIKWEAVTVTNGEQGQKQSYWHLVYSNCDRITEESEIEQFLKFARGLGISAGKKTSMADVDPADAAKVLADRDDTQTRADIYFTDEGIGRLNGLSKEDSINAYLQADADLSGAPKVESSKPLERFLQISKMWFFVRVFYWREMSRLKDEYERIAPGRIIESDARILGEATTFAESIGEINQGDAKSAERFFMNLGKASGFEFMRKIAALSKLVTVKDTILHELSISGGGLTLGAVDEGEILHPEKAMHRILTGIA